MQFGLLYTKIRAWQARKGDGTVKKTAKIFSIVISALMLCACAGNNMPETPTPTQTSVQTSAPTAVPTKAPTPTPKADPTPSPRPFPSPVRLGNLKGTALFDGPAKYFSLRGEGTLIYIYDRYGELVKTFSAYANDYSGSAVGFFGEYGIVGTFSLKLMEHIDDCVFFADVIVRMADGDIVEVFDRNFENRIDIKALGLSIGKHGGILPFEDRYLLLEAEYDSAAKKMKYGRCVWLDKQGNITGEFDPSPFGRIRGVLNGRHIVCSDYDSEYKYKSRVVTLDGRELIANIEPEAYDFFTADGHEPNCSLSTTYKLVKDKNFVRYRLSSDDEFKQSDHGSVTPPQNDKGKERHAIEIPNRRIVSPMGVAEYWNGKTYTAQSVYAGITDDYGNWLFRIYNPNLASDSQRDLSGVYTG